MLQWHIFHLSVFLVAYINKVLRISERLSGTDNTILISLAVMTPVHGISKCTSVTAHNSLNVTLVLCNILIESTEQLHSRENDFHLIYDLLRAGRSIIL